MVSLLRMYIRRALGPWIAHLSPGTYDDIETSLLAFRHNESKYLFYQQLNYLTYLLQGLLQSSDILKLFQLVFIPRSWFDYILFRFPVYFRLKFKYLILTL